MTSFEEIKLFLLAPVTSVVFGISGILSLLIAYFDKRGKARSIDRNSRMLCIVMGIIYSIIFILSLLYKIWY